MNIQILEIRLMKGGRTTRGFADVRMDEITIRDFRIYCNGKPSIRTPFSTYKDATGDLKFREIISLPPNVKAEVDALILSEFFRRSREQAHEQQQSK